MADLFDKISGFTVAKEAMEMGIYPFFRALSDSEGTTATFEDKDVVMLGSNNYLGLTTDERVRGAAIEATRRYGTSVTGSRFLNGTLELHLEADRRLADFVGKEAALVFATGYQTNLGTVSALLGKNDVAILDKDAHACLVDGVAMSRGQMKRFRHNDVDDLERVLSRVPDAAGKLVIVDGVYSMGGDFAHLPQIVEICHKYGARLLVDDAHGIGVAGGGRGTSAHFGLTDQVDLIMGTFSKSFASIGGFIAGSADVIHYVQHHARSLIFSAALPAPNLGRCFGRARHYRKRAGTCAAGLEKCGVYAQGLEKAGIRHLQQPDADNSGEDRGAIPHRLDLGSADRRGCVYQSGCSAGDAAKPGAAAHELYRHASPASSRSRLDGIRKGRAQPGLDPDAGFRLIGLWQPGSRSS